MDKDQLIALAKQLPQPSSISYNEYVDKSQMIIADVSQKLRSDKNIKNGIGENNEELIEMNLVNHSKFMSSLFFNYDPKVFLETVLWVYRTYTSRGVKATYWQDNYHLWLEVLEKKLHTKSFQEISVFYQYLLSNHTHFLNCINQSPD